ncbi:hypothetical protein ACFS5M_12315 [Lacinutrix iliipiscaria]|uniref:Lipoprotein n=1 Tax=Lacinutrix iliipiscaria TaxID=1230532 RepID=A0ABW5WP45_9FLAO
MKLKNYFFIILLSIILVSCFFGNNPSSSKKITKDFWLNWFEFTTDRHILFSFSDNGDVGNIVVENTVYAVGFNDDFIIAKQHPIINTDNIGKPVPNLEITNYIIIDIRNHESGNSNSFDVHNLNKNGYLLMRKSLEVPDDLTFSFFNTEFNK